MFNWDPQWITRSVSSSCIDKYHRISVTTFYMSRVRHCITYSIDDTRQFRWNFWVLISYMFYRIVIETNLF